MRPQKFLDGVRSVEGFLDVFNRRTGDLADRLRVDRTVIGKVLALQRRYPAAADEILIFRFHATLSKGVECFLDGRLFSKIRNCHDYVFLSRSCTVELRKFRLFWESIAAQWRRAVSRITPVGDVGQD